MFFLNKKPSCKETDYIDNAFLAILNSYGDIEFDFIIDDNCENFDFFKNTISNYAKKLDLNVELNCIDQIEGEFLNLPIIYDFNESEINDQIYYKIDITPFGLQNLNVSLCELILLLVECKITQDQSFEFEDDFKENYEFEFRPFLILCSIYFGFGFILLKRHWISGQFNSPIDSENYTFKYYLPLGFESIVYSFSCYLLKNETNLKVYNQLNNELNKEINKEIKTCINYLEKNKNVFLSTLNLNSKSSLKWGQNRNHRN